MLRRDPVAPTSAGRGIDVLKGTPSHNAPDRLREENARQIRRRRRLEAIFRQGGVRPILDLLEELVRHGVVAGAELDWRLAAYAELDSAMLRVTGGDRLPPPPIRAVGGR